MEKPHDRYHRLHETGKRVALLRFQPKKNNFTNVPHIIDLSPNIKLDCASISDDLRLLLIDVIGRGYHPLKDHQLDKEEGIQIDTLTDEAALNIIWGCIGRELGITYFEEPIEPIKTQLMRRLCQIDLTSNLSLAKYTSALSEPIMSKYVKEYEQQVEKRNHLKTLIEEKVIHIIERYQASKTKIKQKNARIAKYLSKDIINVQNTVFKNTLIAINIEDEEATLIFQQCYPEIVLPVEEAVEYLGEDLFHEKVKAYEIVRECAQNNNQVNFCHFCLLPIVQPLPRKCSNLMATEKVQSLILTDPYVFYAQILRQYLPKLTENMKYIHPYLQYYKASKNQKKYVCNRYICNDCFTRYYISQYNECQYCEGTCDCPRCAAMDYLTKAIALYFAYSENLEEASKIFDSFKMNFTKNYINIKPYQKNFQKQERFLGYVKSKSLDHIEAHWQKRKKYVSRKIVVKEKTLMPAQESISEKQVPKQVKKKKKQEPKPEKKKKTLERKKSVNLSIVSEENDSKDIFFDDEQS